LLIVPVLAGSARALDVAPAPNTPGQAQTAMLAAQRAFEAGDYEKAQSSLARVRALQPGFPGAAALAAKIDAARRRDRFARYRAAAFNGHSVKPAPTPRPDAVAAAARTAARGMVDAAEEEPALQLDANLLIRCARRRLDNGDYKGALAALSLVKPDDPLFSEASGLRHRIEAFKARQESTPSKGIGRRVHERFEFELERDLRRARKLFNQKKWYETIRLCERMLDYAPHETRVRDLYRDATVELTIHKVQRIEAEGTARHLEALGRAEHLLTPPRELSKLTRRKLEPEVKVPTADELGLEKKLNEKVSLDLIEAPLGYVLDLLSRSIGINLIVDPTAVQDKTVTINVKNTTVDEVLDFITRTEQIQFTRGRSVIYVTTPDQPMLETRFFRLNKGLTNVEMDITGFAGGGGGGAAGRTGRTGRAGGGGATRGGGGGGALAGGGGNMAAKHGEGSDIERLLEQISTADLIDWPTGSTYYLDRKRNILFVRSTPKTLDKIDELLRTLDENPIQVLVTTRFIEINAEDYEDVGVNWNLTNNYTLSTKDGADNLVIDAGTGTSFPKRVAPGASDKVSGDDGITFGLTGILTPIQFQATLKAIRTKFKGRVVNAPHVLAVNNTSARFQETEDLWYIEDYDVDRTDLTGTDGVDSSEPILVPVFRAGPSIGFQLTVTPSVGKDSRDVTLLLEPIFRSRSLDSITSPIIIPGFDDPVNIERPIVKDRRMWAKVTVRDGYHVALGGMITAEKEEIVARVPILGETPLLGRLFRRRSVRNVRKHLLVFVSARILTPEGRMYKTEDEERREAGLTAEMAGKKINCDDLPTGVGVDYVRTRETTEMLNPPKSAPDDGVIDLKVIRENRNGTKGNGAE
jgi:type II secretory pathway component GspD/PulD (secretin)